MIKAIQKNRKAVVSLLLTFTFLLTFVINVSADETNPVTGYWQFINSNQEIPSGGHTLLASAKEPSLLFPGTVASKSQKAISNALENKDLQITDPSTGSFLFIQNKQEFYIQLQDGSYLKRDGDLTALTLTTTTNIEHATLFSIERIDSDSNTYAAFRIYEKFRLSNLYLTITEQTLSLDSSVYSSFYILAEATKATEPRFGTFTKTIRVLAVIIGIVILFVLYRLYNKKRATLITITIGGIATLGLVLFFLIFANTEEKPGLYVLYKSTFEPEQLTNKDDRTTYEAHDQILEDGSAKLSFQGDDSSAYIWGIGSYDHTIFAVQSSGSYTDGQYTIQLKGYKEGTYELPFYYYDVTKDLTSASDMIVYTITVNDKQQITSITEKTGEK